MTTKVDDRQALRPTEAQLRWAQFHRKTRAQQVQEKLERLYQSPASPSGVPEALPEDGNSSTASSSSEIQKIRQNKPKISRGRRAMLRVSKRHFESRRLEIQQHGFQCSDDKENEMQVDDEEDAIIAMFADESVLKKHRRRRASRRHRPEDDEQRLRRFEAAYHSLMMNLMPQEQPDITPAKGRWTRASHIPVAVSIDGRQYDDLSWGFSAARRKTPLQQQTPASAPFDRRASWLVHLPARQSTSRRLSFAPAMSSDGKLLEPENGHFETFNEEEQGFFSPGQMKFDELVARLRQRELELQKANEGTPMGQREAQGKAAKFREKYSRRHSSEGVLPEGDDDADDTDFLARDIYGFPYVEESPNGKSLDTQSQGGFSFGGDSDFWRSARNMHATIPEQSADQYLLDSLHNQKMGDESQGELNTRDAGASPPNEPSPVQSSLGGESEFWRHTRNMHATTPALSTGEHPRGTTKKEGTKVGKLQVPVQKQNGNSQDSPDSLVKRRVQEIDPNSPYADSPIVPKLSHDKLEPFTEGTRKWQPPLKGARSRETDPDSVVRRRIKDMNSLSGSMDQDSPPGDMPKLSQGRLEPFEDNGEGPLSPLVRARGQLSGSMVRRRVQDMSSPSGSTGSDSPSRTTHKLSQDKLGPFEGSKDDTVPSIADDTKPDSKVRHRIEDTSSPTTSVDLNDNSLTAAQKPLNDKLKESSGNTNGSAEIDSSSKLSNSALHDLRHSDLGSSSAAQDDEYALSPESTNPDGTASNKIQVDDSTEMPLVRENETITKHQTDENCVDPSGHSHISLDAANTANVPSGKTVEPEVQRTPHKGALAASAALRIGSKVGGMLNSMLGGKSEEDADELKAFAAFRKSQDERRISNDDATSASSYRLLPEGIRRVVKNFSTKEIAQQEEQEQAASESMSPSRSAAGRSMNSISPEHGKYIQHRAMENSQFIGEMDADPTIIDTDGTTSDATYEMDPKVAASLFLSPTILTKRLHQAIRAIERHNWEQVMYLLNANPWLAEMTDVTTGQFLLHKLALYGAGVASFDDTGGVVRVEAPAAPEELTLNLIRMFPPSVHKFDQDGNLPLHMAAVSGNREMCRRLGERFPSGASVRNVEGLLPLHMAIQSCSSPAPSADGTITSPSEIVETILGFFPGAIAVTDNDGNLPIHCAAAALHGEDGAGIIYMLLDEADRQVENNGLMFRCTEVKSLDDDTMTVATDITGTPTESSVDDSAFCNLVRNNMGHTPLMVAIRARSGWEIIEAIACGPGGGKAALMPDANMCNALHLLVSNEFSDPAAILSILKLAPHAAAAQNNEGMLPIEIACRQMLPKEVILALVLVDLPVDVDEKAGIKLREGFGGSWCFLTCECDDHYADVVEEVISICSYPQVRELCFAKCGPNESGGAVITRATPKCRLALRRALRFVGRFEFLGSAALETDLSLGLKVFEALDFGTEDEYFEDGRRVLLHCYSREKAYLQETATVREYSFDHAYVEEMFMFGVHESVDDDALDSAPQQFCIAIELPSLTLDRVVDGMTKSEEYHRDPDMRTRYFSKVCVVLRLIAKSLRHLHETGVVHGDVCLENCGKFDDKWKVLSTLGMQPIGKHFQTCRMGESSPPESVELLRNVVETRGQEASSRRVTFKGDIVAEPAIDIWAYGKLMFEVLTGEPLIQFDPEKEPREDNNALITLKRWNDDDLRECIEIMKDSGVSTLGIDLVSHCLLPDPSDRPTSMEEILEHKFWKEMRRKTVMAARSRQQNRQVEESEV